MIVNFNGVSEVLVFLGRDAMSLETGS